MIHPMISKTIRGLLRPLGFNIVRLPTQPPPPPPPNALATLIKHYAIDTIIDVGANEGQFGVEMRNHGFKGLIISIEPLAQAFEKLQSVAMANGPWEIHRNVASDKNGVVEINVAGNSQSSSVLPMARRHEEADPASRYVGKEIVPACTLDSLLEQRLNNFGNIFLKLDVQGFEHQVLLGGPKTLAKAAGVLLEASIVPLYEGSICLQDTLKIMTEADFLLHHVERVFWDAKTQQLLQLDCAFFRNFIERNTEAR